MPSSINDVIGSCQPKQKVAFAKTHKTGGSTVQNIFLRYGWKNNLTFVVPKARTWMFNFKMSFNAKLAHTYPLWNRANTYDIFTFHSVWNYKEVRKLIPKSPVVTILRDPVNAFESGYEVKKSVKCMHKLSKSPQAEQQKYICSSLISVHGVPESFQNGH